MKASDAEALPVLVALSPSSGRAGMDYPVQVTIEGNGFAQEDNVVIFGGIPVEGLPSSDGGTRISFWVPKEIPSTGEVPPMVLDPGEYEVTVTTPRGISNSMTFTLTPGV
jgi:hypothetical protein